MAWKIHFHAEVEGWLVALDERAYERCMLAIGQLGLAGPGLGRPLVDTVEGSRHRNMKELRTGSVRVLFAFDPKRQVVLLVAGDKAGFWSRWYRTAVPLADQRYDDWLVELAGEEGDGGR